METLLLERLMVQEQFEGRVADQNLLTSITENGILDPILVYYSDEYDRYIILDGHRRYDAATQLDLLEVPVTVLEAPESDSEATAYQVIINRDREELNPTAVADALHSLKRRGMKQKEIARRFGMSESDVSVYISFSNAHPKIRDAVDSGRMSFSAAEPLLSKSLEIQDELADAAIGARTVRKVRALIKAHTIDGDREVVLEEINIDEDADPLDAVVLMEIRTIADNLKSIREQGVSSIPIAEQLLEPLETIQASTHEFLEQVVEVITDQSTEELITTFEESKEKADQAYDSVVHNIPEEDSALRF